MTRRIREFAAAGFRRPSLLARVSRVRQLPRLYFVVHAVRAHVRPAPVPAPDRSARHSPVALLQAGTCLHQPRSVRVLRQPSDNDTPPPVSRAARIRFQLHAASRPSRRSFSDTRVHPLRSRRLDARSRKSRRADRTYLRSEEHTSELQSRGLISYAGFFLKKKKFKNDAAPIGEIYISLYYVERKSIV